MQSDKLLAARAHLDSAIADLEEAHATWSEAVTALHMAEIKLRKAQKHMRQCYGVVADLLNGAG